jgi:hypothetical protein
MKNNKQLALITLLLLLLLNSCANIVLDENAASVNVYYSLSEKSITNCNYVGDVVGSDGNFLKFWYMSNLRLTRGALNDIRNKANAMGGDSVFILQEMLEYTTTSTFVGSVYRCNKK